MTNRKIPWKKYIKSVTEILLAFYIATFCLAMTFKLHSPWSLLTPLLLLYLFVIGLCAHKIYRNFPLPALMLIVPIAPFLALVIVISLIPVLQLF